MVKTPCQTVEQPASLSLIVPLATRRVRARRLQPVMIKPRLASRPLLQPALSSPLTFLACLLHLWPDPPPLLSCLLLFEHYLLSLRSSTHWGCIQTMLNAGLLKAFCVNIIMHVLGFRLYLLFILLAVSFAALPWSPPSQPDSCSAVCGWGRAWPFGRASTLAFLDCSKVNGKPASRLF